MDARSRESAGKFIVAWMAWYVNLAGELFVVAVGF